MLPNRSREQAWSIFHTEEERFVLVQFGLDLSLCEQGIFQNDEVLVRVA